MHRISRNNPVRRRLFSTDDMTDQARIENFTNNLLESAAREKIKKMDKWNFDFENEIPLAGTYAWFRSNGAPVWIGVETSKFACDDVNKEVDADNFLPMKFDNELTPKSDKDENAPLLRKRRKESVDNTLCSDRGVKRKISFD